MSFMCQSLQSRSESLGQVFIFSLTWLHLTLQGKQKSDWKQVWLLYDNMCQLIRLRSARGKLPFPPPYDEMWLSISKAIDAFHIVNHKDESCHTDLHPDNITEMFPELADSKNTQAAEQTFVWLGRFKKIVCSMNKTHHLFYIHRSVTRRNEYSAMCYKAGKKPLLPGVKNAKTVKN